MNKKIKKLYLIILNFHLFFQSIEHNIFILYIE